MSDNETTTPIEAPPTLMEAMTSKLDYQKEMIEHLESHCDRLGTKIADDRKTIKSLKLALEEVLEGYCTVVGVLVDVTPPGSDNREKLNPSNHRFIIDAREALKGVIDV